MVVTHVTYNRCSYITFLPMTRRWGYSTRHVDCQNHFDYAPCLESEKLLVDRSPAKTGFYLAFKCLFFFPNNDELSHCLGPVPNLWLTDLTFPFCAPYTCCRIQLYAAVWATSSVCGKGKSHIELIGPSHFVQWRQAYGSLTSISFLYSDLKVLTHCFQNMGSMLLFGRPNYI